MEVGCPVQLWKQAKITLFENLLGQKSKREYPRPHMLSRVQLKSLETRMVPPGRTDTEESASARNNGAR